MKKPTVIIIGGGAAGFFSACQLIDSKFNGKIIILEKDKEVLKKVRISGEVVVMLLTIVLSQENYQNFIQEVKRSCMDHFYNFNQGTL